MKMDTSLHHITSCVVPIVNCNSRMGGKTNIKLKDSDEHVVPDSTTPPEKERLNFEVGEDVLLKHKDGRYYLGTIVDIDFIRERCFLRFGDNTQSWSGVKDLTKLSLPESEDYMCVVCKKSAPKDKHEITICDKCGRGYHSKCHQPHISEEIISNGDSWVCKKCNDNCIVTRSSKELVARKKDPVPPVKKLSATPVEAPLKNLPSHKRELPYEPDILTWDSYHRVNMEQIYCYCGQAGEWFTQMLQCGRCKQWFHEKCVRCLKYPLYCGDRFYVFVCSTCNNGKEFLRRLEMKWVDLVHLMLFNLTAFNAKKYYDLDSVIIPYVNDNWHALQLPPKINNTSKSEIRETILNILTSNRNRFKCGREIKKRTTIWGLRVRLPPPAPCVTLPSTGPVTEAELKERWLGNKRLQFLPQNDKIEDVKSTTSMVVPVDPTMLDLMMGTNYFAQSDSDSPCSSPETDDKIGTEPNFESNMAQTRSSFEGGGFVKRSVPFPTKYDQENLRRKKLISGKRDKTLLRRQKRKFSIKKNDTEKNFTRKLRYRQSHVLVNESNEDESIVNKSDVSFPPTPPTSVSAPPTPPATSSNVPQSTLSEASSDGISNTEQKFRPICDPFSIESSRSSNLIKSNICKNSEFDVSHTNISLESNTPCDTSGDETSSKSTLDLIIPPPKDFKGKNNPFHNLPKDSTPKREKSPEISSTKSVSLPLSLNPVIPVVRTLKRQLSEKDIFIGPNGEVKRRRFRRNRNALLHAQTVVSKTAAVVPARNLRSNVQPIANCVDYALNGRRLRQRQDKAAEAANTSTSKANNSVPNSPVKSETNIDDLKSSVNIYFGAANRIASGEKFTIRASRIGPEGKLQYLIEWEGHDQSVS